MSNQQETIIMHATTPEGLVVPITLSELREEVGTQRMDKAVEDIVSSKIRAAAQRQADALAAQPRAGSKSAAD